MYVVLWEFKVRAGCEADFTRIYGPGGEWARLFAEAEGFVGTELLKGRGRFVTVDRWTTREAHEAFRSSKGERYAQLDAECESLTEQESRLGDFETVE